MLSRLPLIVGGFLVAAISTATAQDALECTDLDIAKDGDARIALNCIAHYKGQLEALEAKIDKLIDASTGEPRTHEHEVPEAMPPGLIAAFDLSDGCPTGWSPFAEGQGRTIIGASFGIDDNLFRGERLTQRKYRDHGGEEEVILTIGQIPEHRHEMFADSGPAGRDFPSKDQHVAVTASVGSGGLTNENFEYQMRPGVGEPTLGSTKGVGANQPHENMPPYIALYYCKKN